MTDETEAVAMAIFGAMIRCCAVPGRPRRTRNGEFVRDAAGQIVKETTEEQIARRWAECAQSVREQSMAEARAAIAAIDKARGRLC